MVACAAGAFGPTVQRSKRIPPITSLSSAELALSRQTPLFIDVSHSNNIIWFGLFHLSFGRNRLNPCALPSREDQRLFGPLLFLVGKPQNVTKNLQKVIHTPHL